MKRSWLIIAGGALLLISTAAWWLSSQKAGTTVTPRPTPAPVVETVLAPDEPTLPGSELGTEEVNTTTENFARRVKHVPDTRPPRDDDTPTTNERDITAGNVEDLLQANLDQALNGDMASAYFVTRTRMTCERFANTPEDLERRIQRTDRKVERDIKRGRESPTRGGNNAPWSV